MRRKIEFFPSLVINPLPEELFDSITRLVLVDPRQIENVISVSRNWHKYVAQLISKVTPIHIAIKHDCILRHFTSLTSIDLCDNHAITDAGIGMLARLTSIDLCGNHAITDASLSMLIQLTSIDLRGNRTITDASINSRLVNIIR